MPRICYVDKKFNALRRERIDQANVIIKEYQAAGYELTLRQLYYQFVARDLIKNNQREYKNLGDIINEARLAGLIDWNAIVDRTRNLRSIGHWDTPADIIASAASSFRIDKWVEQEHRIEIWIEKDALVGVIENACNKHDIPFFSCRGYTSQSELWGAAMRMNGYIKEGQEPVVIHLGDHDPSGKDMTRDIEDRFEMFCGRRIKVQRIALNMDQINKHKPPPNPCKITDSRAENYMKEFGDESWELDALDPKIINGLIETEVAKYKDMAQWRKDIATENKHRENLTLISSRWSDVVEQFIDNSDSRE